METITSPLFTEETVTDFDIVYVGGLRDTLTLRKNDHIVPAVAGSFTQIVLEHPPENIYVNLANVLSYRTRERIVRHPIAKPITEPTKP